MKKPYVFDPPPPEENEAAARLAASVNIIMIRAVEAWRQAPNQRRAGITIQLWLHEANLEHNERNATLPTPEAVWAGVQEALPREVQLRVHDYKGDAFQCATLTWRGK